MDNRTFIKGRYSEKKGQTKNTDSQIQKNHPIIKNNRNMKDKIQNNTNNLQDKYRDNMNKQNIGNNDNKNLAQNNPQQKNNHENQEKIGISQKKEYIPYSCKPQLEKNDTSFLYNNIPR